MKKRASIQDIADRLGVCKMTVSLALRKHPKISEATRKKVETVAAELGYRKNPELSKFMSAIRRKVTDERGLPLAYITTGRERGKWRESATERQYWEGAQKQAEAYGFYIMEFWLEEPGMTEKRLSQILWSRGIQGVILHPFSGTITERMKQIRIDLNLSRFATVTMGDTLTYPVLNRVVHDHYASTFQAMDALVQLGYKRIGFCMTGHMDRIIKHRWQAAYRVYCENNPVTQIKPLIRNDLNASHIGKWCEKHELDAIISAEIRMRKFFEKVGLKMGEDVAYADLDIDGSSENYDKVSGINQNPRTVGKAAVDLLISEIQRNQHGIPKHPLTVQVEGTWQDRGSTPSIYNPTTKK